MKKILIAVAELAAAVVLSSESSARDLERELWFYADFDSPMRVDGNAYFAEGLPVHNEIEGKFGKAQYFPLAVANRLPPMKALFPDGYPVALTGGVFTVPPQKIDHPFAKWDKPAGTYTCSFYAKGCPGTTLTLEATLSPSATGDVLRVDTYVLTTAVQRVWTWAKFDRRTVEKRKIALKVTASGPVELERFQYERTGFFGRMSSHPGRWTEGGTSKDTKQLVIKDQRCFSSYPAPCGSFSAWIRRFAGDYDPSSPPMVWGCRKGGYDFGFNGNFMHAGNWWHGGRMPLPEWQKLLNAEGWHHVAGTWSPERQALWVDGTCVASTTKKMALGKEDETIAIHVGGGLLNGVVGDVAIDDLAVFRTQLTDEEIRDLAKGERPVLAAPKLFVATPVSHALYHRDQTNAALRLRVVAPTAGEWTLEGEIAGRAIAGRKVSFGRGVANLAVPFEPARFKVGTYPWKIALRDANHQVVLERSGELEILPRLARDGFLYMSWGGNYAPRTDFLKAAGFNAYILSHNADAAIDAAVRNGFYVNVRYENGGTWKTYGFGPAAEAEIAAKAARDLAPLEGLHAWRSTLINSEVYYYRAATPAFARDDYLAEARRALGLEPDFCILRNGPAVYDYRARRESVPKGVLSPTNGCMKALATLDWFSDDGQPFVRVAGATAPTVRRISGGGTVWTEPLSVPSVTKRVDMVADWFYNYANRGGILKNILWRYGQIRTYGKAFMPTLGMYFDEFAGFHPTAKGKDGKPLKLGLSPSVDDYQVKCWIALGATRLDALSVFSADTWDRGAEAARAYLADPSTNVFQRLACVAEPDAPERSGEFIRNRILPAAELLRGYETVRAPIALLVPSETFPMSGTGWHGYHYPRAVNVELAESCLPYDIVADREMKPEVLSKYRYLAWPLASVARPEHDAAVRAAAERGSTVVLDDFAELTYPGAQYVLKKQEPVKGKKKPARPPHPYRTWFTAHTDDVRALLPSLSTGDLGDGFTFEKRHDGVRFVIVANDKRRPHDEGGFLTQFCTNVTYRPYGAQQTIVTMIRDVGEGAVVYEFNGGEKDLKDRKDGNDRKVEREFAPGEGVVYCVYPEPLKAPELSVSRLSSSVLNLAVKVATKSGKPAPARTVLKVEVREASGALREESGLYRTEKGVAAVPIRLADGEKTEGLQVSVIDLTTGLGASLLPSDRFQGVKVGGEIGHHLDLTVGKVLRHTDVEKDFLRFFQNRVPSEGRIRDCEQAGGPYGGFVGYGMFLDGVVKACARGIGGAELKAFKDKALADLIATQGKDGSISVFTSIPKGNIVWDHRATWDNHESAYILQALANDYLAFGTRTSREAAVRLADHMMEREEGLNIGCETAFVLVWQATKDPKYRAWLERQFRIAAGPDEYGPLVGGLVHVYKTIARSVAQLDYALAYGQTGNAALTAPAREVMGRLLGPYSSVTGSCTTNDGNPDWGELWGVSQHGVGKWGETCASAYAMRLATRLQAIDPSPVYGDYIERVLYNAFFAAQSEDGVKCRYFVPFDEPGEWWPRDTYCCPNNFRRWIFELPDAVILKTPKGVAVNLYTEATYRTDDLTLEMKTRYPEDGAVEIVTEAKRPLELKLRIPRWSEEPDAGSWRVVRLGEGRQVTKLAFRLRDRLVRGTGEQSGKVALVRGPVVFGLDKDGKRIRFSDPRRVRTYFAPPADAKTVPDELFCARCAHEVAGQDVLTREAK